MRDTLLGKRGRTALLMLGMLAGTILVLVIYAVTVSAQNTKDIRDTQLEGTPVGKKLVAASDRILDCTEPGDIQNPAGECYRRNQQNTARILADAQRIIILSAACSVEIDPNATVDQRIAQITQCVMERLTKP